MVSNNTVDNAPNKPVRFRIPSNRVALKFRVGRVLCRVRVGGETRRAGSLKRVCQSPNIAVKSVIGEYLGALQLPELAWLESANLFLPGECFLHRGCLGTRFLGRQS